MDMIEDAKLLALHQAMRGVVQEMSYVSTDSLAGAKVRNDVLERLQDACMDMVITADLILEARDASTSTVARTPAKVLGVQHCGSETCDLCGPLPDLEEY